LKNILLRIVICILPTSLTPLWAYLIAEGFFNFGGGEKDLLLIIPWMAWSFIYMTIFIVTWTKKIAIKKGILYSIGIAASGIAVIWIVMYLLSFFIS